MLLPDYTFCLFVNLFVVNPLMGMFYSELKNIYDSIIYTIKFFTVELSEKSEREVFFHWVNMVYSIQTFAVGYGALSAMGFYLLYYGIIYNLRIITLLPFATVTTLKYLAVIFLISQFLVVIAHMVLHRYGAHQSFTTSRWFQFVLQALGVITYQRGILWWKSHHVQHHTHCDTLKDPHSPIKFGLYYSHIGWLFSTSSAYFKHHVLNEFYNYPEIIYTDAFTLMLIRLFHVVIYKYSSTLFILWISGTFLEIHLSL
eukprot:UN34621